ncbi:amidase [Hyaloscypha finlandica]|nr:amidase [Hyaloscypha finlandica]
MHNYRDVGNRETTIDGVHNVLFSGVAACRDVVSSFLSRIEAFNPAINSIISLNPNALRVTNHWGMSRFGHQQAHSRCCCSGCFKNAGVIILGKTNFHELALEGLTVSSLSCETINPYDFTRTPGGSSGGTGAEIASSFAVFGTGSDTANSLRSPASANSLFAFRPTRGLISRPGIIPVSYTQDAIGPVARNTNDLAVALTVMASTSFDPLDNTTPPSLFGTDYAKDTPSNETTPVNDIMNYMISVLQKAGVEIVPITETLYNCTELSSSMDVQASEIRESMDAYLQMHFSTALLHAIIYLEQTNLVVKIASPSQIGRNGILTALTGFPVVTVPAAFSPPIDHAPIGAPIGMEILGLPWSESMLINIASHISALAHANICKHVG